MRSESRRKLPLLGLAAYLLVPGERRRRAAGHFRKAGFETLLGLREFASVEKTEKRGETVRSERIEIE